MEGVGARLGRSSSRYGTTTVFTGPVRKWSKSWVPISPSPSSSSSSSSSSTLLSNAASSSSSSSSSSSVSHLRLFKWTPLSKPPSSSSPPTNANAAANGDYDAPNLDIKKDVVDDDVALEPPRRKFKYIPVAVLEEKKKENERNSDDEAKPIDADEYGNNKKPDINDVPMEENEDYEENQTAPARQDLNELDLSLGLTSHEEEHDSDS